MYTVGDIPDEQPDLAAVGWDELDVDQLRGLAVAWAAWWFVQADEAVQTLKHLRAAMRSSFAAAGHALGRMQIHRWSQTALSLVRDVPTTARDFRALRNAMTETHLAIAGKASRAALQSMPTARELRHMEPSDRVDSARTAGAYAKIAQQSHALVGSFLHLDKLPPEINLSANQAREVLRMLPRAFTSFTDEQLDQVIAMARTAKGEASDVDDIVTEVGL